MEGSETEPPREPVAPTEPRSRIRSGPTLGTAPISVGINFGVPLAAVSLALLYSAIAGGGTLLWISGVVSIVFAVAAFASGRTLG